MPGELFLIRHGETEWSRSGQHTSRTDLPLTEQGRVHAKALGEILKGMLPATNFALVLASPLRRAMDTAHLAGYQPEIEENLHEWDYGSYEGLTSGDIQKTAPGWTIWTGPVPGGESPAQVGARADRVIQRCAGRARQCRPVQPRPYAARAGRALARTCARGRTPSRSGHRVCRRAGLGAHHARDPLVESDGIIGMWARESGCGRTC